MAKAKTNGLLEISSSSEFEKFIKNKNLIAVDFWTSWCMPCLMMAPIIEELADKFKGKIEFAKVNVDDNRELAAKHKIVSIPTLMVFKKGEAIERITGSLPQEVLEEKFRKLLK